jgi:phosphatidylglycerophosphate synthase
MAQRYTIEEIRSRTYKTRDAWWTVLLVDPLASRLVQFCAPYRWITPNRLTLTAFALGLASAACFALADYRWLVAGALLFHLSFVVDCMDGKIARLNGNGSVFGVWLDFIFDQLRVVICTIALMAGQYAATGEVLYLAAGGGILIVDMLRYLNAWQIGKVKNEMRARLAERTGVAGRAAFVEELLQEVPAGEADVANLDTPIIDVHRDFRSKFATFVRIRNYLIRHRIRIHLVSGIEFQMAAFVVGPIIGAVVLVPAIAGALLLAFELMLIYKLWLSTRSFDKEMAEFASADVPAAGSGTAGMPTAGGRPAMAVEGDYADGRIPQQRGQSVSTHV